MGDSDKSDVMPRVDFAELNTARKYAKIVEQQNLERAIKLKKLRSRNLIIGGLLGSAVLGIYSYSILAVKQETFLDDFEEPARDQV